MKLITKFFSSRLKEAKPIHFFYELRDKEQQLINGILDVDSLEGFADSIEDFLNRSLENEVIITKVVRGNIL